VVFRDLRLDSCGLKAEQGRFSIGGCRARTDEGGGVIHEESRIWQEMGKEKNLRQKWRLGKQCRYFSARDFWASFEFRRVGLRYIAGPFIFFCLKNLNSRVPKATPLPQITSKPPG